jgi:hypothetical protein
MLSNTEKAYMKLAGPMWHLGQGDAYQRIKANHCGKHMVCKSKRLTMA